MIERVVMDNFIRMGWSIQAESSNIRIPLFENRFYIPDIALYDENRKLFGIVEVMAREERIRSPHRLIMIKHLILTAPTPVVIITNGHAYDIYIHGKFVTQTVFCPTLETCLYLLRSTTLSMEEGEHL